MLCCPCAYAYSDRAFYKFGTPRCSKSINRNGIRKKLFDTSKVHTINIIMDDWDDFTANCKSKEYYSCTVVIDNEAYKNVAIRGKGNTSFFLILRLFLIDIYLCR